MIPEITVEQLQKWINEKEEFQLIDVREPHEKLIADIGGELIPLGQVPENLHQFSNKKVVIYCRSGKRSADATEYASDQLNRSDIFNLKGGILAWGDKIDSTITKY
ncbi:MAG: rhodanese-like domain-containing protein [Flavobacteriales bacterium]|nr:rhodanese-like domain-containing protein [Flavobacteriales bacterium]